MVLFIGRENATDTAIAKSSTLVGFTGGSVAELQDGIGDDFYCASGDDFVIAAYGDDIIRGDFGADTLNGGGGNDTLEGGANADRVSGGNGDDVIFAHTQANPDGPSPVDILNGNAGSDTITGSSGDDYIDGGAGVDQLRGGSGNDVYSVNVAGEAVETGGGGSDTVRSTASYELGANLEHLVLLGGNNITATGNALANRIVGNAGNNTLTGGLGLDVMTGRAGLDRWDFNAVAESGVTAATRDIITDFAAATNLKSFDRIDVATIDANAKLAGNQAFIFGGDFTAGHIRAAQYRDWVLLQFNTDQDAAAEMIIQLNNVLAANLNAGDFIL